MRKRSRLTPCDNRSVFDYSLLLKPSGAIKLFDKNGEPLKGKGSIKPPSIKRILNTRTLTIVEAEGSRWIWVSPPGRWYQV